MTAELRTVKSTKANDGKDKTAAELKDLKTENDTLTGSVQKLEADLLKKNAQVSELESEFETEKTSAQDIKKKGDYVREQLEFQLDEA